MWDYLHHCRIDIKMNKTITSADGVGTPCGESALTRKLTSHFSFLRRN